MAYANHLLFNNIYLRKLKPGEDELASARHLVHNSARDWYSHADFSSPAHMAQTWIQPLLNQQSLDLVAVDDNEHAFVLVAPWDRNTPLALCFIAPHGVDLDGLLPDGGLPKGQHWMIRVVNTALDMANLRWAVLTNGIQWRLMDTHSLRRYEAFLEVDLFSLLNGEDDDVAAYLFYRLLRLEESFERDPDTGRNKLDALLQESGRATEATESYLKTTVSDNLNTPGGGDGIMAQLCMGLVRAIDPQGEKTFTDEERAAIYRDATYLLYRLLFILYAEARNLLPMDREDYQPISLQRLIDEATELRTNPQRLAKPSTSLWKQLSTLFNAIEFSDEYIGIPAYNGGLFQNDDKPYLSKYKIQNSYLAEALYELAYLVDESGEAPERIDYRDLSVRHLGSLYEGMIEYNLFIAEERLLARRDKDGKVKYLPAKGESRKSNDEVIEAGKVYFAQSPHERKATGTHYTAEDLVERLVRQTVLRLLNELWQAFAPQLERWFEEVEQASDANRARLQHRVDTQLEEFVRQQVLTLRACDPAMGSGHFLVHIAHQMTNFILWVLTRTPWANEAVNLSPDYWRRQVVESSLYGVDVNQMAVELAKLSLWLATMQIGRPLSFLDHHLKWGNSLLGTRLEEIIAVLTYSDLTKTTPKSRVAEEKGQYGFKTLPQAVQTIQNANDWLEKITIQVVTRAEDIKIQEYDYEEAQRLLTPYKKIGDLLVARKMGLKAYDNDIALIAKALETDTVPLLAEEYQEILAKAEIILTTQRTMHWELEFSHVFGVSDDQRSGFDIVIGNPPFIGGSAISAQLGNEFLRYLKSAFSMSEKNTDFAAYFFRRGFELLGQSTFLGFVSTNTISQGDTRVTGLMQIIKQGGLITYADRFVKWAGDASVEVNLIAISKNDTSSISILDGRQTPYISSYLDDLPEFTPARLARNKGFSFNGDFVHGKGFVITPEEKTALIQKNRKNSECIYPFLNGYDLNNSNDQKHSRYIICFHDWTLDEAKEYPDLLKIIEERVKPERAHVKRLSHKTNWWLYGDYRRGLRKATATMSQVLVRSAVSEYHMLSFVDTNQIFSHAIVIIGYDTYYHLAILQSRIHEIWLRRQASTMRTDIRYTPSDCFQTFPFPQAPSADEITQAELAGQAFYEYRQQIMLARQLGLTKLYNLFNNYTCQDADIIEMRRLQAEMDRTVLGFYDWQDIDLHHDFYPNDRNKFRFTPAPEAQREIFTRLIALNQEIAAQEAVAGLVVESADEEDVEEE